MESPRTEARGRVSFASSEQAEIRAYLDKVLATPTFAASPRRTQLLRYLVDRTLAGEGSQINEYAIGLDVFEKPASFDPRADSTIRAEVSRLRQKLRDYYLNGGRGDAIVIEFPQRSYVPSFTFAASVPAPAAVEAVAAPAPDRSLWPRFAALAAAAAVLLGTMAWRLQKKPANETIRSLVVLPFQNLSASAQDEYLADGLTEELTNELTQRPDLRVVARTSAFQFKGKGVDVREIGRTLNVDAVLEGSFARQGDRIRITAQLNRCSNGYHLWSRSYDARWEDSLTTQDRLAREIASAVRPTSRESDSPPAVATRNPEAHDIYLQANHELAGHTPEAYRKGLDLLESAVSKDPSYVSAYIGIARAEIALIHITAEEPRRGLERARAALAKASELDPHSAEAHGEMADLVYVYDRDWPRAENEFRLAIDSGAQSTTRSFYGWALATRGRFQEAHEQFRIAQDLDPLGQGPRINQVMAFILERRFAEAKRSLREILDTKLSVLDARLLLGLVASYENDCGEAKTEFEWCARTFPAPVTKFGMALSHACAGEVDQARRYLAEAAIPAPKAWASPYQLAIGYARLGDRDKALAFLEKSADSKEGQILYIKYDPAFDGLRSEPRFVDLEKRMGL